MVWDKTRPAGGTPVNQSDDGLRENNDAIEPAFNHSHEFVTGGGQSGKHVFVAGDIASRLAAYPSPNDGNIWLNDGTDPSPVVPPFWEQYNGSAWQFISVADPDVARVSVTKTWLAAQYSAIVLFTVSGVGPLFWDWDASDRDYFGETLTDDTTINNPTNAPSAFVTSTWLFDIVQDAGGGHTLTFDTLFRPAFGGQPAINSGASERTTILVWQVANQDLWYQVIL